MSKTVIIYASFGQGHKKAALALGDILGAQTYDLLDFSNPLIKKIYSLGYDLVSQYFPRIWQVLFFSTKNNYFSSWVDKIHRFIFASFFKFLQQNEPKIIVVTHFFPSNLRQSVGHDS